MVKEEFKSPIQKIRNFIIWIGSKDFDHILCKRLNIPYELVQKTIDALDALIIGFETFKEE